MSTKREIQEIQEAHVVNEIFPDVNASPGSVRYLHSDSNSSHEPDDVDATTTTIDAPNNNAEGTPEDIDNCAITISDESEGPLDSNRSSTTQLVATNTVYPTTTSNNMTKVKRSLTFMLRRRRSAIALANRKLVFVLSVLLLAAIIAIIILALRLSNNNGPKSDGGVAMGNTDSISTLSSVRANGTLNCGVVEYPGFADFDELTNTWSGFEVDLCRAVGAAIFGQDGHVTFTALTNGGRFSALQEQQVDLVAAGATYTMERDVYEPSAKAGFTFSVPYLYDGLSFAGKPQFVQCADQRNVTGDCSGLEICVQDNTTHVAIVEGLFPGSVIKLAPTSTDFYSNFVQGHCNVLAGEQFDLASITVTQAGYTGNYSISNSLYSKEPLALVTRDDDSEWSDFVNWVFLALLSAENKTVTQEIAQNVLDNIENPGPTVDLSQLWAYQAVATVGNYAELYNRHLQSFVPRASVNRQNNGTSPLIYSFPFGDNATTGPGPVANGTLDKIKQRGFLICGTYEKPFFAEFNHATHVWSGFDVDYCRAVSAAIFGGIDSTVFVEVDADTRWEVLNSGTVDILSRDTTLNYERDVKERTTMTGFTFTQTNFYSGVQFGGVPPYGDCADRLDVSSSKCENTRICVTQGTTTIDVVSTLFPNQSIVPQPSDAQVYGCLGTNKGNAIAGDGYYTATSTVTGQGYNGTYQAGTKFYSRENLAVVTRQDDVQWSSFVFWVVSATFYAAENGISNATYSKMPTTNIFGPGYITMLQDTIQAVGSYDEITARNNAGGKYPIRPIDRPNQNPLGPQHFPPPGLFGLV